MNGFYDSEDELLLASPWVWLMSNLCGICHGQSSTKTGSSPTT